MYFNRLVDKGNYTIKYHNATRKLHRRKGGTNEPMDVPSRQEEYRGVQITRSEYWLASFTGFYCGNLKNRRNCSIAAIDCNLSTIALEIARKEGLNTGFAGFIVLTIKNGDRDF